MTERDSKPFRDNREASLEVRSLVLYAGRIRQGMDDLGEEAQRMIYRNVHSIVDRDPIARLRFQKLLHMSDDNFGHVRDAVFPDRVEKPKK